MKMRTANTGKGRNRDVASERSGNNNAASNGTSLRLAGMPVGRRTPRGRRRWYLVHAPGREQATCDKVRKLISPDLLEDAFVVRKERWHKHAGEWESHTVALFQDYFVVVTRDVCALDRELAKLTFPARVSRGEGHHFAPMAEEAQAWYEQMMDATHTIRTSTGVIVDGELRIQDGPMVGQESRVVKIMRRKSACKVAVGNGGAAFEECVPFVVPFKS